ncbi:hypothetical protein [Streptomyces sp. Tu 3180]|uniref:hypothetical protein n=1 Tax=Streptomyces sp. Tu 3180 TaxID=2682611 RepID=UPI001AA06563|nr:hypothetical protein [Streptomyces sp. Tu 3180]
MSDELAAALRGLAERHETPPRVDAAGIRARAGRRSRRRRTAVALGAAATAACALTAVAFALHTGDPGEHHRIPATASDTPDRAPSPGRTTPLPTATPVGHLDLGRHTLTVGDRVLRVDSHSFRRFPPGTRLTVTATSELKVLSLEAEAGGLDGAGGARYEVKVPYLVELRTPDGEPVYAGALTFDLKSLAALPARTGWLGMSLADAEWFHHRARTGDHIELTTAAPDTGATTPTPTEPERATETTPTTETGAGAGTGTETEPGPGTPSGADAAPRRTPGVTG